MTAHAARRVTKWLCDYCKVASFLDYDEACLHEAKCQQIQQQIVKVEKRTKTNNMHPFFVGKKPIEVAIQPDQQSKKTRGAATRTSKRIRDNAEKKVNAAIDISDNNNVVGNKKKPKTANTNKRTISNTLGKTQKSLTKGTTKKSSSSTTRSSGKGKTKGNFAIFDLTGNGSKTGKKNKAISAEDAAAEFLAKRRRDQDRERERQRRRQENQKLMQKSKHNIHNNVEGNDQTSLEDKMKMEFQKKQHNDNELSWFVPFPQFSHVMPPSERDETILNESTDNIIPVDLRLRSELNKGTMEADTSTVFEMCSNSRFELPQVSRIVDSAYIQEILSAYLNPPSSTTHLLSKDRKRDELLVDHYQISRVPEDICGVKPIEVSKHLMSFIQDWMIERQNDDARMEEKQRAFQGQKRKRKKKQNIDDCLWYDSDSLDGDDYGLCNVCVLTGPVGSGKTSLIHAIARHYNCPLIEINTSVKRGSLHLKRTIEEATQSYSSLDMFKKQKKNAFFASTPELAEEKCPKRQSSDGNGNCREKNGSSVTIILIDEVDALFESNGDNGFWSALTDLSRKARCPIILTANTIPDGLLQSSLRYKHLHTACPLPEELAHKVLTVLSNENFQWRKEQHDGAATQAGKVKILSSIAQYCNNDFRRILHEIQLFSKSGKSIEQSECSNRNILHEDTETIQGEAPIDMSHRLLTNDGVNCANIESPCVLSSVYPKEINISSNQASLLEIGGRGFLSLISTSNKIRPGSDAIEHQGNSNIVLGHPVKVYVGNRLCPEARILDDNTILAVCQPPHECITNSNRSLIYMNRPMFASIKVEACNLQGIISSSIRSVTKSSSASLMNSGLPCLSSQLNLHYVCNDDNDDNEFEFEIHSDEKVRASPPAKYEYKSQSTEESKCCKDDDQLETKPGREGRNVSNTVDKILKEGIQIWHKKLGDRTGSVLSTPTLTFEAGEATKRSVDDNDDMCKMMDNIAKDAELASDAALFSGVCGIPHLSGASKGFGCALTEMSIVDGVMVSPTDNISNNESKKLTLIGSSNDRTSEARLFALGWKDSACFYGSSEAFVTIPVTARERNLLNVTESTGRGNVVSIATDTDTDDIPNESVSTNSDGNTNALSKSNESFEEDILLPFVTPEPIFALPSFLNDAMHYTPTSTTTWQRIVDGNYHILLERRKKDAKVSDMPFKFLEFILSERVASELARTMDYSLSQLSNDVDRRLMLDYAPFLRVMALHESCADNVYQEAKKNGCDLEESATRRSTRRSKQRGRTHYFEKMTTASNSRVIQPFTTATDAEIMNGRSIGSWFADSVLL